MESLSSLYYNLTFEENAAPREWDTAWREISLAGFVRRAQLKVVSLAWLCLAVGLFTVSLENVALAVMKQGDRGAQVTTLQKTLKTEGYFKGPVTGYYGPITAEAVRRFQQQHQLAVDGIVGVNTEGKLYDQPRPEPVATQTAQPTSPQPQSTPATPPPTNSLATTASRLANAALAPAAANPASTPSAFATTRLLKRGQNSDVVRQLQLKLKQQGYFNGPTTGYYGTLTEAAVKRFQSSKKLSADGVAGPQTLAAIEGREVQPDNTPFQMDGFTSGGAGNAASPFTDWETADQNASKVDWYAPGAGDGASTGASAPKTAPEITAPETDLQVAPFIEPAVRLSQPSQNLAEAADRLSQQRQRSQPQPRPDAQSRQDEPTTLQSSNNRPDSQPSGRHYGEIVAEAARNVTGHMALRTTIYGNIAPKSIVHSGKGLFFAQNMMYTHSITVYDRNYQLVKTISDSIKLQDYGYPQYAGLYRGAPVEATFSHAGQYAWVSNYQMYGAGFSRPGSDKCTPSQNTDPSFLYRVNTQDFAIDQVVKVGSVPKQVAASPDNRYVLVTNWCTDDLSVVDVARNREVRRIKLGRYPRGIVIDAASQNAYVAVMGSQHIAKVSLTNFKVDWFKNVGRSPRHLNIDAQGKYLYASLNGEGRVAKIDLKTGKTVDKVVTGNAPRSMVLSQDGQHLYVVNYESDTMAKVRTQDMQVVHTVSVNDKPIGITYDAAKGEVWVSCYSGSIMVFAG
ncbi:MAG: peptidoglycan-binding protein [Cyanobacteria bacterium P01_G01_bin.54]